MQTKSTVRRDWRTRRDDLMERHGAALYLGVAALFGLTALLLILGDLRDAFGAL